MIENEHGIGSFLLGLLPIGIASSIGAWMRWGSDQLKGKPWSLKRLGIEGISVVGFSLMANALAEWFDTSVGVACGIASFASWLGPKVVVGLVVRKIDAAKEP